jgi:hypothetical protein
VTPRLFFLSIVGLEAAHTATAIALHRVPSGHDGFQYFTLQYFFLNNAIQAHEVAQWIPYMNQGTVASLWYGIQASFLQAVLLQLPWLASGVDLLSIYHIAMFVDEMILLTGTWLLARRFFDAPTVVFVSISIVASCVWLDQPYWNFRLYYAIPLVLELGHRFLDTGRWRWMFLTANLLALQTIGNLPYLIPMTSFVVFAYFAFYTVTNRSLVRERLHSLRWDWRAFAALVLGALCFAAAYTCVTLGTEPLVGYNWGRNPSGTTDLRFFMSFGGFIDIGKWNDTVLRISPAMDNTLFGGMLLAPLLVSGLILVDRRRFHLVLTAGILLLFTLSTPVSRIVYYAWPGMWYFRHIGLVSSLVKVLFCFVAGVGFEWLFASQPGRRRSTVRAVAVAGATVLAAGAWWAMATASSPAATDRYASGITVADVVRPLHTFDRDELAARLRSSAIWAAAGAVIVGLVPLVLTHHRFTTSRVRQAMLWIVLAFIAADLYQFKFSYLFDRSDGVGSDQLFLIAPSRMPFSPRRVLDAHQARAEGQSRLVGTIGFNRLLRRRFEGGGQNGAQYWTNNAFWFVDEVNNTFQADSWLAPLDQFARMFRDVAGADFPVEREAAAKLAGMGADKIRFFAHAYSVPSSADLAPLLTDGAYKGDLLFVSSQETASQQAMTVPWRRQQPLSADDSRFLPYHVERFDANNLIVKVSNTEPTGLWMFYSDVWHPSWRATVNGRPVSVHRANVAYKAVPIEPGENVVHFHFGSDLLSALAALGAINAALWLIGVSAMMARVLRSPDPRIGCDRQSSIES